MTNIASISANCSLLLIFKYLYTVMIEGFVHLQRVTQYSTTWRNCWMRIDERSIHIYYRPNSPPKCVKASRVSIFIVNITVR